MLHQRPPDEPSTLYTAYIHTLQELHATKHRLLDALTAWRTVVTGQAALVLNLYLELTRVHVVRLASVLQRVGGALRHVQCLIADDLLRDADRAARATAPTERSAALLKAAYRVQLTQLEQYEVVCVLAQALGDTHAHQALESALAEERGMQCVVQSMASQKSALGLIA